MSNKQKLKGKRVYIDDDLTKREREIQGRLIEVAKAERNRGKQVRVGYQKISVEGVKESLKDGRTKNEIGTGKIKMMFWNVAGLMKKLKGGYKEAVTAYMEAFDVVGLVETWMQEDEWKEGWIAETTGGANGDRKVIIGGDWNARTGIMGDPYIDELGNQVVRESKEGRK
ncbi:hypothetical protein QE152_g27364 [Popillia japonica]|uniref:Endonuclease/exonuclease/phosphatase domain-containing protein n=1 Tax=Popillia japonica TaxID=7064 RepID=A0AAW1JV68_POPJA